MSIHELLAGHHLRETEYDDPGTSTPLATIAAPGATAAGGVTGFAGAEPVAEFALTRLKPLRRLKHLDRGAIKD